MKIIDIHTHGGFGVDFNTASKDEISFYAKNIKKRGVLGFCPTLATDSLDNLSRQLEIIKEAMKSQKNNEAKILGVHFEACFLNPKKCGIHNPNDFLELTSDNFKKLGCMEIIRIVALAPELDCGLVDYLRSKNIIVHAGHSEAESLWKIDGTTHHFNAMPQLHHRRTSITLEGMLDNSKYCEIIADLEHVSKSMLELFFKVKNKDKIILISDSLPIAHSPEEKISFCGKEIYKNGKDAKGKLAGSIMFLDEIGELLIKKKILSKKDVEKMLFVNPMKHLGLKRI